MAVTADFAWLPSRAPLSPRRAQLSKLTRAWSYDVTLNWASSYDAARVTKGRCQPPVLRIHPKDPGSAGHAERVAGATVLVRASQRQQ